jgi:tRNA(Ile)-lysidine synthase
MIPLEQQLLTNIQLLQKQTTGEIRSLWVAYSGGVDSHALLFALAQNRSYLSGIDIRAVHIDHQLTPLSSQWSEHCRHVCEQLQLPFRSIAVDAQPVPGQSPEAKARQARYEAFKTLVKPNHCLLTAHHQDDQAETLFLQLLRGSGPRGLAAMPRSSRFAQGYLARPLLDISREQILQYARHHKLQWIDDISNDNPAYDRNFLRLQVIPLLKQRWPSVAKTVSRSAQLCADTINILDEVAEEDLRHTTGENIERLSMSRLQSLSRERQHNVVRAWLNRLNLPCPPQKTLLHIWQQVIEAEAHATPCLQWPGGEVRRYRDHIFAMSPMPDFDHSSRFEWDVKQPLAIAGAVTLDTEVARGEGLSVKALQQAKVSIRFRQGGERCQLPKRSGEHSLKNLFQELAVVPWMRERLPLVYVDERLAAIGDLLICEGFQVHGDESAVRIVCDYVHPVR